MSRSTHVGRWARHTALAGASIAAAAAVLAAAPADASTSIPDLVFSVGDGESPEGYLVYDPNCPVDIICKPQRVAGQITFRVDVNVSLANTPITVQYTTTDGTARQPGDYSLRKGTLRFEPGDFTESVTVPMSINPGGVEPTEAFFLDLSSPSIPGNTSDRGVGTILDGIEVID